MSCLVYLEMFLKFVVLDWEVNYIQELGVLKVVAYLLKISFLVADVV